MRVLKWVIGAPIAALLLLAVIGSFLPPAKVVPRPAAPPTELQTILKQREDITNQIQIVKMSWTRGYAGRVEITGTFSNNSARRLKDIELSCGFYGDSGTVIDSKKVTVYQLALSRQPVDFKKLFIGYAPDQSKSMKCVVSWFLFDD